MTDQSLASGMRKVKGIGKKPQQKTSNPIQSPVVPGRGLSKRQSKQNELREMMENDAETIINLMSVAIKTGKLGDEKISNTMRLDLIKNFMPYVLPQLKSVEYVEVRASDIQPLVINMHGGSASIKIGPGDNPSDKGNDNEIKVVNPITGDS